MSRYDTIVEIKKFNPFHDAQGKFSSANGFASYSANPNTKAGAMAIARSAAAGHGNTVNVHRQSYGENIRQNANWLGQGKQVKPGQKGNATLRSRVEPTSGLAGASATGASWQYQNQQQGRTTSPGKQKPTATQQQAKPAPKNPTQAKPAPKNPTQAKPAAPKPKSLNNFNGQVDGKDMLASADRKTKNKLVQMNTEDILKAQGMDGTPRVVSDQEFVKIAKSNGNVAVRTVWSKSTIEAEARLDQLKNGDFYIASADNNRFGNGMYVASRKTTTPNALSKAHSDSIPYGHDNSYDRTMYMTIDKSAKRIQYKDLETMAKKEGYSNVGGWGGSSMQTGDIGSYAALKGYDVIDGVDEHGVSGYSVILNRTKVTMSESTSTYENYDNRIPASLSGL